MHIDFTPAALNTEQAAHYIGVSSEYLKRARIRGDGPPFSKIGRRVVYLIKELDQFLNDCRITNTCMGNIKGMSDE